MFKTIPAATIMLALAGAGCTTGEQSVATGAIIGAGTGAAVGALITAQAPGAIAGTAIGGATGAIAGAASSLGTTNLSTASGAIVAQGPAELAAAPVVIEDRLVRVPRACRTVLKRTATPDGAGARARRQTC